MQIPCVSDVCRTDLAFVIGFLTGALAILVFLRWWSSRSEDVVVGTRVEGNRPAGGADAPQGADQQAFLQRIAQQRRLRGVPPLG